MIKEYKYIACLLLLTLCFQKVQAQQAFSYTQYMHDLVPVNPAFALTQPQGGVNLVAKKQWVNIKGSPSSVLANAYLPLGYESDASAGLMLMHDNLAVENLSEANAFIAKAIRISETDYLSASVNFGVRRYATNYASLDPTDPVLQDDVNETAGNIGFGVMLLGRDEYDENTYFVGVSMPRISIRGLGSGTPKENRYFKNQYYITGGFNKYINDNLIIKPAALVSYTANLPLQADFSTMFYIGEAFGAGFNYRTNNEVAAILSCKIRNAFQIGYSYQTGFGTNKLAGVNNGTHEIGLSYKFGDNYY